MNTATILWRDLLRQVRLLPLAALFTALPLNAQVPSLINYQGRLTNAQGNPVTGNRTMAVRIYDAPSGGSLTYEETIGEVPVNQGLYNFRFGQNGTSYPNFFAGVGPEGVGGIINGLGEERYLALSVNGTEESMRTRLLAVPFALVAQFSLESQSSRDTWALAGQVGDLELKLFETGALPSPEGMVFVAKNSSPGAGASPWYFFIDRTEVPFSKWKQVRDWAVQNGYADLASVGNAAGENHPVRSVTWFEVLKWCNARSEMENLEPVYYSGESVFRSGNLTQADFVERRWQLGYRLPHSSEWEWAAAGGVRGGGIHTFSGSNDVNEVAWYSANSAGGTQPVATKSPNELGLHDMSGNVREWCGDSYADFAALKDLPQCRGGGWKSARESCSIKKEDWAERSTRYDDVGFRAIRRVVTSVEASGQFSFNIPPPRQIPSPFDQW